MTEQYRHFNLSEFVCSCGCSTNKIEPTFVTLLDEARHRCAFAFHINSGYRCEKHNREVGSTSKNHTSGRAADIECHSSARRFTMLRTFLDLGIRRIGLYPGFIHVDTMPLGTAIWLD